jgi:histidine kinase-like protein
MYDSVASVASVAYADRSPSNPWLPVPWAMGLPRQSHSGNEGVASWRLPRSDRAPARARRAVRVRLDACGLPQNVIGTTELLVSELVTNALCHATHPLVLSLAHSAVVRCWVEDGCRTLPARREPTLTGEHGRGLVMVEELASDWGSFPTARGKATWFELDVTDR